MASKRGKSCRKKPACCSTLLYFRYGNESSNVKTLAALNPGLAASTRIKLLIIKPEPTSNISESATSATTSTLRARLRPPSEAVLAPSLSSSFRFAFVNSSAGATPDAIPVKNEISKLNEKTHQSIPRFDQQ